MKVGKDCKGGGRE
jgi:hypothetical protein